VPYLATMDGLLLFIIKKKKRVQQSIAKSGGYFPENTVTGKAVVIKTKFMREIRFWGNRGGC
jgi:hypothetical protein